MYEKGSKYDSRRFIVNGSSTFSYSVHQMPLLSIGEHRIEGHDLILTDRDVMIKGDVMDNYFDQRQIESVVTSHLNTNCVPKL